MSAATTPAPACELLIRGGRIIDPETGLDQPGDVALTAGRIVAVGPALPHHGDRTIEARGRIVAPGFIDLHSHAQTTPSARLQALDGVTTALELEAGAGDVAGAVAAATAEGRPINFGYSASWADLRTAILLGTDPGHGFADLAATLGGPAWQGDLTSQQRGTLTGRIAEQLAAGGIGVGMLVGYAPGTAISEFTAVSTVAADFGSGTFTHARHKNPTGPHGVVAAVDELVTAAEETGAHTHLCHLNSTSLATVDRVTERITRARERSLRVTTEAYPYGAGMTAIGAPFLAPEQLGVVGAAPDQLVVVRTGERPRDAARLRQLRTEDPSALVVIHYLDEDDPADLALLHRSVFFDDTAIASDAISFVDHGGHPVCGDTTLPDDAISHPRSAGTFAKFLRLARETDRVGLVEAVRRCSLLPAQILSPHVPVMRTKGRVQVGCDADLVVFDPDRVSDRASYTRPATASVGFDHVLVGGIAVVTDGELTDHLPGRAVLGGGAR